MFTKKFWEIYPYAKEKTLEDVNERTAVVEIVPPDKWTAPVWGCIDKNFSVGYIFGVKCEKEQAIQFCKDLEKFD